MNRFKKHKVKCEKPETSTSYSAPVNDYDLAYYIHDRVELMHQVFSVLKQKELKAMAPHCVRHISLDDLQELCTEELLGISSKRLCAILDGAEPPSDTESSSESPERLETISLDSISSDDEILSEASSKKNKKHKRHHRDKKSKRSKRAKAPSPGGEHKRHHRDKKSKRPKRAKAPSPGGEGERGEQSRAARAGLTVLELLELQARARAIRAQLQNEQAAKRGTTEPAASSVHSSDSEVEVKEEPAEVVEISSGDEKPDVRQLAVKPSTQDPTPTSTKDNQPVTKRINDLVITVPQTKQSRKIKLNRSKVTVTVTTDSNVREETNKSTNDSDVTVTNNDKDNDVGKNNDEATKTNDKETNSNGKKAAAKTKKKLKRKEKKKSEEKDSDEDEITLQLSDTEKMDLLEDLDRKNFEKVSSSGSEDSESSSSDSSSEEEDDDSKKKETSKKALGKENNSKKETAKKAVLAIKETITNNVEEKVGEVTTVDKVSDRKTNDVVVELEATEAKSVETINDSSVTKEVSMSSSKTDDIVEIISNKDTGNNDASDKNEVVEVIQTNNIVKTNECNAESSKVNDDSKEKDKSSKSTDEIVEKVSDVGKADVNKEPERVVAVEDGNEDASVSKPDSSVKQNDKEDCETEDKQKPETEKELSDGELSDKESSDVEAFDLKPEIVCISDTEETDKQKKKAEKKKKKKEKKSKIKKAKKSKSDFRESADQNFFEKPEQIDITGEESSVSPPKSEVKIEETNKVSLLDDNYDDVYEILELSDDSSCYEVEGTVLSKEPTAEEIEALSAKIDEIEREDVVTEEEIREHERKLKEIENNEDAENISWKDRYLDSKKVKKVLSTSNIFNALRKKNIELKKKLEESKKKEEEEKQEEPEIKEAEPAPILNLEEGSIEHYKTLQGSTKYVDPVREPIPEKVDDKVSENNGEGELNEETANGENKQSDSETLAVKEMRKDAKQLLKMYKMLLKYNDMNKQKDPSKKKKKKNKKKSKEGSTAGSST